MNLKEVRVRVDALKGAGATERQAVVVLRHDVPKELVKKVFRE